MMARIMIAEQTTLPSRGLHGEIIPNAEAHTRPDNDSGETYAPPPGPRRHPDKVIDEKPEWRRSYTRREDSQNKSGRTLQTLTLR